MNNFLPILLSVPLLLGVIGLCLIYFEKKTKKNIKLRNDITRLEQKIDSLLLKGDIDLRKQALILADKILDSVLKTMVPGRDMGQRLKNARKIFSDAGLYQQIWEAHKMRNKIVHEVGYLPTSKGLRDSISVLRRGWKYLGY